MPNGGKRPGAGRKPGIKAKIAEAYNELLAKEVNKEGLPIIQALITKAKTGDIPAIKELHDRLMGKAPQPFQDDEGNAILPFQLIVKQQGNEQSRGGAIQ